MSRAESRSSRAPARAGADRSSAVASHYRGDAGRIYFAYQSAIGAHGARLNRWKFADHVGPHDVVVDFGCGAGGLLAGLECGRRLGIEVNEHARAAAQARGLEAVACARQVPSAFADVVISNHALEHTLAPLHELRELYRILKPGGTLVLWLPLEDWRNAHSRMKRPDPNHHLYGWTPLLLHNLLSEVGFDVQSCRVVSHAWPPGTPLLSRLPRPLWDAICRAFSLIARRRQLAALAHRPHAPEGVIAPSSE